MTEQGRALAERIVSDWVKFWNNYDLDQVDKLFVTEAYVNEGPRMKRVRPAPMGRAYRYQRRSAHIVIKLAEKGGGA